MQLYFRKWHLFLYCSYTQHKQDLQSQPGWAFLVLFHYTVHHNVNFPHYFIPSPDHILQQRKQTACNYTACQDELSKHAFLMLRAVRVQNKGLQLRSILELCNCPGIQKTTLDWMWVNGNGSAQCHRDRFSKVMLWLPRRLGHGADFIGIDVHANDKAILMN